jgi:hypothetical protein
MNLMKGWINIKKMEPLHEQLIIPYHKDMYWSLWLTKGVLPIMYWNEETPSPRLGPSLQLWRDKIGGLKNKMALHGEDYVEITHWLPVPNEPKD